MSENEEIDIRRIYLNKDLWIQVMNNKIVFGGPFLPKGHHLTFSFGNISGYCDLHLRFKDNYCQLFYVYHHTLTELSSQIFTSLYQSFFNDLKVFDFNQSNSNEKIKVLYGLSETDNLALENSTNKLINKLKKNPTGKRLKLDTQDSKFEENVNEFQDEIEYKTVSIEKFISLENTMGMMKRNNEITFLIKNQFLGDKTYSFSTVNLDVKIFLQRILGNENYQMMEMRIQKAIEIVESEYYDREISNWQSIELTTK